MPIFYPDNEKRKVRLLELATDTQNFFYEATADYEDFKKLCEVVNKQIVAVYNEAGLKAPGIKQVDVIELAGITKDISSKDKNLEIAEILLDVASFAGTIKYFAPAATKLLVRSGVMAEETAARILASFTVPFIGKEVEITAGGLAGSLLSGILGGIAVGGIDLGLDAINGAKAKEKLRGGLHTLYPVRTSTRLSLDKSKGLLDSIRSVKTTLDAISGAGLPLTDAVIKNLIKKDVQPAVEADKNITKGTVTVELNKFDLSRTSWTAEDIH
ncbi:hypothetical protein [Paenibacillus apiarius]|uniref:hypothetical protein n=1 Tax=Paenibacillus apiarius TaxID=46240 RepID=UPI00197D0C74|nr:hypothetical protein [Paenibacillus apiarius]MBN3524538.1 hypothetical protein [Paenibacillus apiarius]